MTPATRATLLASSFYDRDPRRVARALLGKLLVRKTRTGILSGRIVETEAYLGADDAASHSAVGKTARNAVLFGPPGYVYVYFIYGNYYCLNVSCLPDGVPGGVLFRALEPIAGIETMARARGLKAPKSNGQAKPSDLASNVGFLQKLTSGPGRLCQAFGITRDRDNGKNFASSRSDLRIVDDGYRTGRILATPRIGITKSADRPLRYIIANSPYVS